MMIFDKNSLICIKLNLSNELISFLSGVGFIFV